MFLSKNDASSAISLEFIWTDHSSDGLGNIKTIDLYIDEQKRYTIEIPEGKLTKETSFEFQNVSSRVKLDYLYFNRIETAQKISLKAEIDDNIALTAKQFRPGFHYKLIVMSWDGGELSAAFLESGLCKKKNNITTAISSNSSNVDLSTQKKQLFAALKELCLIPLLNKAILFKGHSFSRQLCDLGMDIQYLNESFQNFVDKLKPAEITYLLASLVDKDIENYKEKLKQIAYAFFQKAIPEAEEDSLQSEASDFVLELEKSKQSSSCSLQ